MKKDPKVILNMKRNIGWRSIDSGLNDGQYDIIYEVFIIVRRNETLFEQMKADFPVDYTTKYFDTVYSEVNNRVNGWMDLATRTWMGGNAFELTEQEKTLLSLPPSIPAEDGAATITIWGSIMDSEGRMINLTVTDQTIFSEVLAEIPYMIGVYDAVTDISYGEDLTPYGNPKVRKTTAVGAEMTKRKAPAKSNPKKPGDPKSDSKKSSYKSAAPPVACEYMSEVRSLENGTTFTLKVGRAAVISPKTGSKLLTFNGFAKNAENKPNLDVSASVFIHDNRAGYGSVIEALESMGVTLDVGQNHVFETPITIQAKKMVSANGASSYYVDVKII